MLISTKLLRPTTFYAWNPQVDHYKKKIPWLVMVMVECSGVITLGTEDSTILPHIISPKLPVFLDQQLALVGEGKPDVLSYFSARTNTGDGRGFQFGKLYEEEPVYTSSLATCCMVSSPIPF